MTTLMNRYIGVFLTVSTFVGCLLFAPVHACATDAQDISASLKALLLMNSHPSGNISVAIVFDPLNQESRADAEGIKTIMDNGIGSSSIMKLEPRLVSIADTSRFSDAKVVFLAKGISPAGFEAISKAASPGILTISTDIDCVMAHKCVLGITSKPHVTIYYSTVATEAEHISFVSAFLMLVKHI